jgi:undecaprenyl-diphosphatase
VGTIVAFISGYLSVAGLLRYLRTHSTLIFVVYRISLGLLILYLLQSGILVDNIES